MGEFTCSGFYQYHQLAIRVTYLFPESRKEKYLEVAETAKTNIIILGHTHTPMQAQHDKTWFFNAGSLCCNRPDNRRTCAVLTLPDIKFEVFDIDSGEQLELTPIIIS